MLFTTEFYIMYPQNSESTLYRKRAQLAAHLNILNKLEVKKFTPFSRESTDVQYES